MEQQIQEDLRINPYVMVKVNQTIFVNKYMTQYEGIKKEIKEIPNNRIVEIFCYHGSRLKNHQNENDSGKIDEERFGKGVYGTNNPFYAAYCANRVDNNKCKVLEYNETAHIICCRAIYNSSEAKEVKKASEYNGKSLDDNTINKYGINQVFVGNLNNQFEPISPKDKDKHSIYAYEFVFPK